MSKYTTEVRYICEHYAGLDESVGYNSTLQTIEAARSHIFESDYPIFNEGYRSVLETKILRHFYTREIAAESVGLWKMWLNTRMNEIMPYYNQRYESEFIRFNPLYDTDLATSRDDKFGSQRVDINSNDIINGGNDIINTHNDKNITNSGSDVGTLGGSDVSYLGGSDVNTLGGRDIDTLSGQDVDTLGGRDTDTLSGQDVDTLSGRDVDTLSGQDVDTLSGSDSDRLSGNDATVQTGSITNASSGHDITKYDDRDSSDDDRTTENWKNSNTTDWHFASDTPQSTIASIGDNNYATSFTKDTHIQTNSIDGSGDLISPNDNYEKVHDKIEHNNHNTTDLQHGKSDTETFNSKTDTTNYGKVDTTTYGKVDTTAYGKTDTMAYGKVDTTAYGKVDTTAYGKTDTMAYGKVDTTDYGKTDTTAYGKTDTTDYGKTDTQVYGKITDSAFDEQQATSYGKTTHGEENNNRGFHSTDEWLEHIVGKRNNKSYSQMLNEFRTTFLNIDMEVINELNDLFFNLW